MTGAMAQAEKRKEWSEAALCHDCGRARKATTKRCELCGLALHMRVDRMKFKWREADQCPECGRDRDAAFLRCARCRQRDQDKYKKRMAKAELRAR